MRWEGSEEDLTLRLDLRSGFALMWRFGGLLLAVLGYGVEGFRYSKSMSMNRMVSALHLD